MNSPKRTNSNKQRKKYIRRKVIHYVPAENQVKRLMLVKSLYDQFKTLEEVALRLNLTRERVRQLLRKGHEYKLFTYQTTRDRRFNEVCEKISSSDIIRMISNKKNTFERSKALGINMRDYFKLLKHYQIDTQDYLISARFKKYLVRYSGIVDVLGHHPSTTEMQARTNWRAVYSAIERLWGSIDKFRHEFGIEKPPFAIHPNTILAFKQAKEKAKQRKVDKIYQVETLIKSKGAISLKEINEILDFKLSTLSVYVNHLIQNNKIKRVGTKWTARYVSIDT